jgi:hypothetical protein
MVPMMVVLVLVLVSSNALGAEACEAPRLHDLAPLATAAAQDKVVSQTFSKTAEVCAERGPACDQARAECGALLTSIIQKQVVFDEGVWLRDMLLPYQGQQYPLSKVFGAAAIAPDASCNVDVATLTAAAQRRLVQANRRETLFSEYSSYARWCQAAHQKCLERLSVDDQRAATAKAEAEKLAAAAAAASAASAAELARRQVEDAARKQAQETARRAKEAQATAAAELASREKARVEAEEKARRDQLERHERTKDERERAAAQAEAQRKDTEEERAVKERDARTKQARTQRAQLLADAEAALKVAQAQEETKKQAAIDAVVANPTVAQASVAEAAQAKQARLEAEKRLADARLKAERMEIDESHERSRGHVGLLAGGGVMSWGTAVSSAAWCDRQWPRVRRARHRALLLRAARVGRHRGISSGRSELWGSRFRRRAGAGPGVHRHAARPGGGGVELASGGHQHRADSSHRRGRGQLVLVHAAVAGRLLRRDHRRLAGLGLRRREVGLVTCVAGFAPGDQCRGVAGS